MAGRNRLSLSQRTGVSLTPGLRTGLSVLRMPTQDLEMVIRAELSGNPFLELDHASQEPEVEGSAFEYLADMQADVVSLGEHLRQQLGLMDLSDSISATCLVLTWSLNEDGYLDSDLTDVAQTAGTNLDEAQKALEVLQSCDPAGVGARTLKECLVLQLASRGFDSETASRALDVAEQIERQDWRAAVARSGLDESRLKQIARCLPQLSPYPALAFQPLPNARLPDVAVAFDALGRAEVSLIRAGGLNVRLNEGLAGGLSATKGRDGDQMRAAQVRAQELIRAVGFRNETLVRVSAALVSRQQEFFRDGPAAMQALTRESLADDLGMHPSTVGRAVADKLLAHPGGVMPLSAFFPQRLDASTSSLGNSFLVQRRIVELVAAESDDAVLSDHRLALHLQNEGVDIARRTVAKYRGCLHIPPSHIRKRRKALARRREISNPNFAANFR